MPPVKKTVEEKPDNKLTTNMRFYSRVMNTPKEAQKPFNNGRFSGTDTNPMWRIQKLTELFGPAGQGWWTQNEKFELVPFEKTGEIAVFCSLELVYVDPENGLESRPIKGVGGNMFVVQRKSGLQLSDEAYKMAYTDALSIACKALGFAHDIYFSNDRTKYTMYEDDTPVKAEEKPKQEVKQKPANFTEDVETLKGRIQRGLQMLVKDMDDAKKEAFVNEMLTPVLGSVDYKSCNDAVKLQVLLDALLARAREEKAKKEKAA